MRSWGNAGFRLALVAQCLGPRCARARGPDAAPHSVSGCRLCVQAEQCVYIVQSHGYVLQLAGRCCVTASTVQVAGQATLTLALVQRDLEMCVGTSLAFTARSDAGCAPLCTGLGMLFLAFIWGHLLLNQSSNKLLHPPQAVATEAALLVPGALPLVHGPPDCMVTPGLCRTSRGCKEGVRMGPAPAMPMP